MNKRQHLWGIAVFAIIISIGFWQLEKFELVIRLLFGLALGYALTRSAMGFAGSVNRAYRSGSTKLMQALMLMFVITAFCNAVLLLSNNASEYNMWVNPINFGLIAGALLFGFGMSFSSCCASGVMTSLLTDIPRGITTLLFFGLGVFIGFPLQKSESWVSQSWFATESYRGNGVFMPDLFGGNALGVFGALMLTLVFATTVIWLAKRYEKMRKEQGRFVCVASEQADQELHHTYTHQSTLEKFYYRAMVKPWNMTTGAIVIASVFTLMMLITHNGWGASGVFGFWFGKLLISFGVPIEQVATLADRPEAMFTKSIFNHSISVQNMGIMAGALIGALLMGKLSFNTQYSGKQILLFAMGGFLMGLGTRLANGCNVGALYTPIANFSLSGWVFFSFLIVGGILGNKAADKPILAN